MRVLVTGAKGFVGQYTVRELRQSGHAVTGFDLAPPPAADPGLDFFYCGDLRDSAAVNEVVAKTRPEACVHLGALSFVPEGWRDPGNMFAVNLLGTIHLLEACRQQCSAARILVVSSAEVYGQRPRPRPVREDDPLDPDNPYALSKATADRLALMYAARHGLPIMTVRPYNHIGPGQEPHFVVASFAAQLARIARNQAPAVLKVGNLESRRDFTDVRDVVRAYRLLLERGRPGQAYNLCSQRTFAVRAILEQLCKLSGAHPALEIDPRLYRPAGERPVLDTTRIESDTQWKPETDMGKTLRDVFAEADRAVRAGSN